MALLDVVLDFRARDTQLQRQTRKQRQQFRQLRREIASANRVLRQNAARLRGFVSGIGRYARTAAVAFAGIAAGFAASVRSSISFVDNLAKTARAANLTVEELQGLRHELELQGVDTRRVDTLVQRFTVSFGNIRKQSSLLKTTLRDLDPEFLQVLLNVTDQRKAFELLIDRVRTYRTDAQAASVLEPFVGARQAARLAEGLRASNLSLRQMTEQARQAGPILTTELSERMEGLNDTLTRLRTALVQTFSVSVARQAGTLEDILQDMREAILPVVEGFGRNLPVALRAFQTSFTVVSELVAVARDNFDKIVVALKTFVAIKIGVVAANAVIGVTQLAGAVKTLAASSALLTLSNPATAIAGIVAALGGLTAGRAILDELDADIRRSVLATRSVEQIEGEIEGIKQRQVQAQERINALLEDTRGHRAFEINQQRAILRDLERELRLTNEILEARSIQEDVQAGAEALRAGQRAAAEAAAAAEEAAAARLELAKQQAEEERRITREIIRRGLAARADFDIGERNVELNRLAVREITAGDRERAEALERQRRQQQLIVSAAIQYDDLLGVQAAAIRRRGEALTESNEAYLQGLEDVRNRELLLARAADNVAGAFGNFAETVITDFDNIKNAAADLARSIIRELARVAVVNPLVQLLGGNLRDFIGLGGLVGRQFGGPVRRGQPYIVGEGGRPELFIPEQNGRIVSNRDLRRGVGGTTINFNITGNQDPDTLIARLRSEVVPLIDRQLDRRRYAEA